MNTMNQNGKLCVSLDVGSVWSTYIPEITEYTPSQVQLNPDIMQTLLKQKPLNDAKQAKEVTEYTTFYKEGDQIMLQNIAKQDTLSPLYVPQAVGFNGICMNSFGASFLQEIDEGECHQFITDLSVAAPTFLNPLTYFGKNKEWGFSSGISSTETAAIPIKLGSVFIAKDGVLTKQADGFELASPTVSGCTATNVVRDAQYTLTYAPYGPKTSGWVIKEAQLDLVLTDVTVSSNYCSKQPVTSNTDLPGPKPEPEPQPDPAPQPDATPETDPAGRRMQQVDQTIFSFSQKTPSATSGFSFNQKFSLVYKPQT